VVNVRAALAQAPPVLDDVAHSMGLNGIATLRRVTVPLIAPGLGAGVALVFIAVVTELTATLLLSPIGTQTLATQFWSYSDSIAYGAAAPYVTRHGAHLGACDLSAHPRSEKGNKRMTALTIQGVTKSFGPTRVLEEIDLHVPAHGLTAILGPSGCGKTTLLRLVAGFADPDSGAIAFGDEQVFTAGHSAPPQHRRVGYVPQEGALFPHLSVSANITFGLPRRARRTGRRMDELLELVGLDSRVAGRFPPRAFRRAAAAGGPGTRARSRTVRCAARRTVLLAGCGPA
jgi:ABC-type thiamine transport system ATPase subunit